MAYSEIRGDNMIRVIEKRTDKLMEELSSIWEGSVRSTHTFLTEGDIVKLYPFVKEGLLAVEHLIVLEQDDKILGFIGIQNHKIEMLFIDGKSFNKGYGKKLVAYGIKHYDVDQVSVNEDNTHAKSFYKRLGFKVYDRHELDEQGMPFPILDMKL